MGCTASVPVVEEQQKNQEWSQNARDLRTKVAEQPERPGKTLQEIAAVLDSKTQDHLGKSDDEDDEVVVVVQEETSAPDVASTDSTRFETDSGGEDSNGKSPVSEKETRKEVEESAQEPIPLEPTLLEAQSSEMSFEMVTADDVPSVSGLPASLKTIQGQQEEDVAANLKEQAMLDLLEGNSNHKETAEPKDTPVDVAPKSEKEIVKSIVSQLVPAAAGIVDEVFKDKDESGDGGDSNARSDNATDDQTELPSVEDVERAKEAEIEPALQLLAVVPVATSNKSVEAPADKFDKKPDDGVHTAEPGEPDFPKQPASTEAISSPVVDDGDAAPKDPVTEPQPTMPSSEIVKQTDSVPDEARLSHETSDESSLQPRGLDKVTKDIFENAGLLDSDDEDASTDCKEAIDIPKETLNTAISNQVDGLKEAASSNREVESPKEIAISHTISLTDNVCANQVDCLTDAVACLTEALSFCEAVGSPKEAESSYKGTNESAEAVVHIGEMETEHNNDDFSEVDIEECVIIPEATAEESLLPSDTQEKSVGAMEPVSEASSKKFDAHAATDSIDGTSGAFSLVSGTAIAMQADQPVEDTAADGTTGDLSGLSILESESVNKAAPEDRATTDSIDSLTEEELPIKVNTVQEEAVSYDEIVEEEIIEDLSKESASTIPTVSTLTNSRETEAEVPARDKVRVADNKEVIEELPVLVEEEIVEEEVIEEEYFEEVVADELEVIEEEVISHYESDSQDAVLPLDEEVIEEEFFEEDFIEEEVIENELSVIDEVSEKSEEPVSEDIVEEDVETCEDVLDNAELPMIAEVSETSDDTDEDSIVEGVRVTTVKRELIPKSTDDLPPIVENCDEDDHEPATDLPAISEEEEEDEPSGHDFNNDAIGSDLPSIDEGEDESESEKDSSASDQREDLANVEKETIGVSRKDAPDDQSTELTSIEEGDEEEELNNDDPQLEKEVNKLENNELETNAIPPITSSSVLATIEVSEAIETRSEESLPFDQNQEAPSAGTVAQTASDDDTYSTSSTGRNSQGQKKKKKLNPERATFLALLNLDPWGEKTVDNEQISTLMESNPCFCQKKVKLEGFNDKIYPLSALAALGANVETVEMCYQANPEAVGDLDQWVGTPLHYACSYRASLAVVEYLVLTAPDSLEALNRFERTPLHMACMFKAEKDVVSFLLSKHAHATKALDVEGLTPLHLACDADAGANIDIIKCLIGSGAKAVALKCITGGSTPLHLAIARNASTEVIVALVRANGRSAAVSDNHGRLPLHVAASVKSDKNVFAILTQTNPKGVNVKNNQGELPVDLAERSELGADILDLLRPSE